MPFPGSEKSTLPSLAACVCASQRHLAAAASRPSGLAAGGGGHQYQRGSLPKNPANPLVKTRNDDVTGNPPAQAIQHLCIDCAMFFCIRSLYAPFALDSSDFCPSQTGNGMGHP
eukprot:TRINITY_DN25675_c0_g1_i2.p1 TRINITY_DN25675_c0_g1~~TRINITY_DN25675_c0_g1_i2.p1  ORF type:complete len:114 (+),score=13.40 TRINITY_DN25675_c0_g1_i2:539-880(+)